jgi:hypothetical protein
MNTTKGFTLPREAEQAVRPPEGHGIDVLDLQGKLTQIPGTVPRGPRVEVQLTCAAVMRGDGRPLDPIGKIDARLVCKIELEPAPDTLNERILQTYHRLKSFRRTADYLGVTEYDVRRAYYNKEAK